MVVHLGLMGKHPGFGDFVQYGWDEAICNGLSVWLDPTLSKMRDQAAELWPQVFDAGPVIRFWIGSKVMGTGLCGVFQPSRDKVGRRYPLLMGVSGSDLQPPTLDSDQRFYEAIEAHMADLPAAGPGASSLMAGIGFDASAFTPTKHEDDIARVWAMRPDDDFERLAASVAQFDHLRATAHRSYWWYTAEKGDAASVVLHAQDGLPSEAEIGWLWGQNQPVVPKETPQQQAIS